MITCCENKLLYTWQVRVLCFNYREHKLSDKLQVLVFVKLNEKALNQWQEIQRDYPEVEIFFYLDNEDIFSRVIEPLGYFPLIRPYLLSNHFVSLPQLEDKAIFYTDPDCLFTKKIDFDKYLTDDIVYQSDCKWYIGSEYFDSKIRDVKPECKEDYMKIDVLNEAAKLIGIDRKVCEVNFDNSGGAQSLLKGVDWVFFVELFNNCIKLYEFFHHSKGGINAKFFENENAGFQTWAISDMNGLLWGLWKNKIKTECPEEFDFAWNTSGIDDIKRFSIYHDAGWCGDITSFNKHSFSHKEPWNIKKDDYRTDTAASWYVQQIIKARPKKTIFNNLN